MIKGSRLHDFNHYGGGMTQCEVATELGVSQQYIQQIEKQALVKFRQNFKKMFGVPDLDGVSDKDFFKTLFSFLPDKPGRRHRISLIDYCELNGEPE